MAYAADNPLGLEPSELAASKRAKEAAAARAAKIAKPGAFMNTPGYQAGSGSELDQFKMENAAAIADANAGLIDADALTSEADALIKGLGTEDASGNIKLPNIDETDALIQDANKAAISAGGSTEIFGDTGFTQKT
jgi:hypothetical protein